jgi:glyceraldehyde-3-phosphate dehydrogenase (ferredoxin)
MLQEHGIAAVIYGGTFIDQDFRDRRVADSWFESRYNKKMSAKDLESTTKYRFDPAFKTGGTFGVNYATLGGRTLSFNYRSIYLSEDARLDIHQKLIGDHYLRQFNQETIEPKRHKTCGEPCGAVCKKMYGKYKKDYEPYQVMGPLSGIFDQRAAERVVHLADTLGFDAISAGGVIAWLMECVSEGFLHPEEVGAVKPPLFSPDGFDPVADSAHNAGFAVSVLESIVRRRGILDLSQGARVFARRLARERGQEIIDSFVFNSFARRGWMVPNQYWSPGVLSPMPIMGKYYMHYGNEFMTPRDLGRKNAERMYKELIMDNCGMCRFHRSWAEEMLPEIVGSLYGFREQFLSNAWVTACRINSRNSSGFWESERNIDMIHAFLKRKHQVEGIKEHELLLWLRRFDEDKHEAALGFWYDIHKGVQETLSEYRPPPDHTAQRPSN